MGGWDSVTSSLRNTQITIMKKKNNTELCFAPHPKDEFLINGLVLCVFSGELVQCTGGTEYSNDLGRRTVVS